MPLQATSGAASYDGFGGGAAAKVNYIEDFFQSYLRTGTGASATVTTGLDGSTKETLVWTKSRSAATNHKLTDNVRGVTKALSSNTTDAEATDSQGLTAFSATGYTLGTNTDYNNSGATYVDWQWVAQPKFFDVVTWTGNGGDDVPISHNLGSTPGFIITKNTSGSSNWWCFHTSLGNNKGIRLNSTAVPFDAGGNTWDVTSTTFSANSTFGLNTNGATYVAYLFAHDAGGFGLTGTDNVISCGSFTTDGSGNATVSLGYEPQWIMYKSSSTSGGDWQIFDSMRGLTMGLDSSLSANSSGAETTSIDWLTPSATGFSTVGAVFYTSATYIYIAIRRGPMKVPTLGTSVFAIGGNAISGSSTLTTSFPVDAFIENSLTSSASNSRFCSRLQGSNRRLVTSNTDAEAADNGDSQFGGASYKITGANGGVVYGMQRAPGFFDEVCYTGTGVARTVTHNLAAVPELMIIKVRSPTGYAWRVYAAPLGVTQSLRLNTDNASETDTYWNGTAPTSTVFSVNNYGQVNNSGSPIVAYLFATCAGVSKVGSYTGNGTTQTINCGFGAGGARFVLIKRTDATGDWYTYDTARGMTVLTDPYLLLNSTAAETATLGSVTTVSTGFALNSAILAAINVNAGTYIFLAIA